MSEPLNAPKNRTAELAVVGSMLVEESAARAADRYLKPSDFFHDDTRALYAAAVALYAAGSPCDVVTLGEEVRRRGEESRLALPGGGSLIAACMEAVTSAEHAEHYSKIVAACSFERDIIVEANKLATLGYQGGDVQPVLNRVRDLVLAKENLTAAMTFDYHRDLAAFYESIGSKEASATNRTGIEAIDRAWAGTREGEVNVWGAAPNVGKSLMLLNLMDQAAPQGRRCLYVGTEMTARETAERHLAIVSGMSATKIRIGDVDLSDVASLRDYIFDTMAKLPISILDKPEPNLQQIESAIASSKAQVVFLDYLERFDLPRAENMRLRVKEFMRQVKSMARRHHVEVHLASQLNRTTYGTVEKRPSLADLSESSAVEKEADRVMLLWRPKAKQTLAGHAILECIQAKGRQNAYGGVIDLQLSLKNLRITERVGDGSAGASTEVYE